MEQLEKQDKTVRKLKKQLKVFAKKIGELEGISTCFYNSCRILILFCYTSGLTGLHVNVMITKMTASKPDLCGVEISIAKQGKMFFAKTENSLNKYLMTIFCVLDTVLGSIT